jgi:hypothetical protein
MRQVVTCKFPRDTTTFYVAHRIAGTNFTSQSCILRQNAENKSYS